MDVGTSPAASILVPCRNEAHRIEACLHAALAQEPLDDGRGVEILVADGMSDDGTREIVGRIMAEHASVRMIDNPGQIVSTGMNAAILAARGEIIVRMDAHSVYAADYVRQCVSALRTTGADNVGGPQRAQARGYMQRAICAAHHSSFAVGGSRSHTPDYEGEVDSVIYGCWRKTTLLKAGLFDTELVRNQDDELSFRLVRQGGRVWQTPKIRSWYWPRSTLRSLARQYLQYGYWKVRVIQKHGRPASARHLVPVGFVAGACLGWLPGLWFWPCWALYGGLWLLYLSMSLYFACRAAARDGWDLLPVLPAVFLVYHWAYGSGFAWGIVDFVLLKRGTTSCMRTLTRLSG
mgnify:CR=1 FL=1